MGLDNYDSVQALTAMLFPVSTSEDGTAAVLPQDVFVNSGCICAVLEAIKAANSPNPNGLLPLPSFYSFQLT